MNLRTALFITAACLLSATGCVSLAGYQESLNTYHTGVVKARTTFGAALAEVNKMEREIYLHEALMDNEKEIVTIENGRPTPLLGCLPPASIKARMDALALVGEYVGRLVQLAQSDAPKRARAQVVAFGDELGKAYEVVLAEANGKASGTSSEPTEKETAALKLVTMAVGEPTVNLINNLAILSRKDPDLVQLPSKELFGAAAQIAGTMIQAYMKHKIDRKLTEQIITNAPKVELILLQIQQDAELSFASAQTGALRILGDLLDQYNEGREGRSPEQAQKQLAKIRLMAERDEVAVVFQPVDMARSMWSAHAALVEYANSPRKGRDLLALMAQIEAFRKQSDAAAESMSQLIELRSGK